MAKMPVARRKVVEVDYRLKVMFHVLFSQPRAALPLRCCAGCRASLVALLIVLLPRIVYGATLSGSFTALSPGAVVDLSAEGQLDWGHWGLMSEWGYNHKYGVAPRITYSFVTDEYLTDGPYLLGAGTTLFGWTNGVPSRATANATNGISIFGDKLVPGNNPTGFRLQSLADPSPQMLKVYVSTSGGAATFSASLGGAPTYTDNSLNGATGPVSGVYTLSFQADSPAQMLAASFTSTDTRGYITLNAATLSGTNAPPAVAISAPADGANFAAPATFSLTAAAADSDGAVTNLMLLQGTTVVEQSASSPLTVTLSNQPGGAYTFYAVATDSGGLSVTSFPVRVYATAPGGTLTGTVAIPPFQVELTAEGTRDWAHWGLNSPASFNHKSGVDQLIPNVVLLNASTTDLTSYTDSLTAFSWSDGTPTLQALMSTTGVFLYATNNPPAGFQLTVPATDLPRRLKIYLGLYRAQGMLQARLSDSSALPYSDASVFRPDSNTKAVYTLVFASANPGANLVVTWTPAVVFDPFFGNVTWQAATLWQQPPQPVLQVVSPPPAPNGFALSFYAQVGTNYTVQFVDDLNSTIWQTLTNLAGPGAFALVTDPAIGPARRFYRVVAQ